MRSIFRRPAARNRVHIDIPDINARPRSPTLVDDEQVNIEAKRALLDDIKSDRAKLQFELEKWRAKMVYKRTTPPVYAEFIEYIVKQREEGDGAEILRFRNFLKHGIRLSDDLVYSIFSDAENEYKIPGYSRKIADLEARISELDRRITEMEVEISEMEVAAAANMGGRRKPRHTRRRRRRRNKTRRKRT